MKKALAAPRWCLAFPDCAGLLNVTTFHLPQPAGSVAAPVYLLWNRGSERLRNAPPRDGGTGQRLWKRWAKVLTLKLRIPHWRLKASLHRRQP